jgi:hypothetical protein
MCYGCASLHDAPGQGALGPVRRVAACSAATRSLLNTAKPMENNPLLLRLKALEKLVEKVGRIDLHACRPAPAGWRCCSPSSIH